jgi:hypothetical protein
MQRGDIYLASFPFGDMSVMKLRPVLLLTERVGTGTEVVVAVSPPAPACHHDIRALRAPEPEARR